MSTPTPCHRCTIARTHPAYTLFNPNCIYCGARLIQCIGTLPITRDQCSARRRAVLLDWMRFGHSEQEIRTLAKQAALAIGPAKAQA